ncbi:MAG: GGDEF domain-containing protein [Proteobacteria bacterium]|nr:GGDEF domain-containing protein [Pseudomonadota bacterium]
MSSNVHEPFEPIYAQGLLLVIFYGYTMNKLLIKGGVIAGISITVSYAFYALFISEMQTQFLVTSLFFQISTNFFGVFSVYSMQKTAFFAYLKSERLQSHNKNLLKQSETDGLTGIGNRRFFNRRFEVLFKTKARGLDHISLVLGDIDLFKNYNDACGHLMGDEALKKVATMLAKNIDERTGFVARFGGEEFIMVLYNKNFEDTKAFIQSLQHQLFEQAINHPDSPVASYLTLSFGFVTLNLNNTSPNQAYQQLVRQADNCLYQAKSSGRNQSIGQRFN